MDGVHGKVEVFPEHFQSMIDSPDECISDGNSRTDSKFRHSNTVSLRSVMGAASILNLLNLSRFRWPNSSDEDDKVILTKAEVETLRSEIADAEERETHLKAQLENVDEVLRSARFSGYLYIRTRWTQLPGEPPILEDSDIDDFLPRFVVLQGSCLYYFLKSTDLSPQDTTLLSDVTEIGTRPNFKQEDGQTRYAFYILTCQGLRFECCSLSEIQVELWMRALRKDCNLDGETAIKCES
ncbi:PH domain-containing protein [Carex littledalei]|uniref:PH domain-containing protein n=1 Tax=Carex littledalei TaxID=544730 RepID=A0A833RIH2_9POAL|nr:PH domain-containing protein [Carex littledalei]